MNINNFCPFSHVGLVLAFQLFTIISQVTPFAHQACETNHLLGETESCWEEDSEDIISHCLQPSQCITSRHTLCAWGSCVGIYWALALIGSAKQAAVETRLTQVFRIWSGYSSQFVVNTYCLSKTYRWKYILYSWGGFTGQNFHGIMISCITENFHQLNYHSKQVFTSQIWICSCRWCTH